MITKSGFKNVREFSVSEQVDENGELVTIATYSHDVHVAANLWQVREVTETYKGNVRIDVSSKLSKLFRGVACEGRCGKSDRPTFLVPRPSWSDSGAPYEGIYLCTECELLYVEQWEEQADEYQRSRV